MQRLRVLQGDITQIAVDAIINAANTSLLGGGGVDGAIHRVGGPDILQECQKIRAKQGGCKVGEAVITTAGKLPAKYVIHTVGPRWNGGEHDEAALLNAAYISCFKLMNDYGIHSASFPNISTGIYRFPKELAAEIALHRIHEFLRSNTQVEQINVVCFESENYQIYQKLLLQYP